HNRSTARAVPRVQQSTPGGNRDCRTPAAPGAAWRSEPSARCMARTGARAGLRARNACAWSPLRIEHPRLADGSAWRDVDRFTLGLVTRAFDANRVTARRDRVFDNRGWPGVTAIDEDLARRCRVHRNGTLFRCGPRRRRSGTYLTTAIIAAPRRRRRLRSNTHRLDRC